MSLAEHSFERHTEYSIGRSLLLDDLKEIPRHPDPEKGQHTLIEKPIRVQVYKKILGARSMLRKT